MANRLSRTPLLPTVTADLRGNQEALNRALYQEGIDNANRTNLSFPKDGTEDFEAPLPLWPTATADLPSAVEWVGSLLYDEDTGSVAWSDGTDWLYPLATTVPQAPLTLPLPVAQGGTGLSALTPFALVFGGTTNTAAVQQLGLGSVGQLLTSQGAGALPAWASLASSLGRIALQSFTADGTYTPTAGMQYCLVIATGAGSGGGGADGDSSSANSGGGGASGETRFGVFDAATIGASQAVTIGAGGAGGADTGDDGADGTATSLGSLLVANPGLGTGTGSVQGEVASGLGGVAGTGGTGGIGLSGAQGGRGTGGSATGVGTAGGQGAASFWGDGGMPGVNGNTTTGEAGYNAIVPGSGGGGASQRNTTSGYAGGNGAPGFIFILEFL